MISGKILHHAFFLALVFILPLAACKKEDPDAIAAADRKTILEYIKTNEIKDVVEHSSGIFYKMEEPGTGITPTLTSRLKIRYVGFYADDRIFDSSEGAFIQLHSTILGWQIGIPLFKNGGRGTLFIPSALGYGPYPPWGSGIRRNAVLIFNFEIVDIAP